MLQRKCEDKVMKFRAFIITRKKLITIITAAAVTAAIGTAEAVSDFKPVSDDGVYRAVLEEGMGVRKQRRKSLGEMIKNALGFDIKQPETILDVYTGGGKGEDEQEETAEDNTDEAKREGADIYEEQGDGPPFPTKEEIARAGNLEINNATDYTVDLRELCSQDLKFAVDDTGPQVLIVHTHTTECYNGDEMPGETERTTDTEKSVAAVGDVIAETLEEYGISVYHDETFHDYPSYQGSYTRSLATVTKAMEEYPSIKIVLDVHRDAFVYEDGTRLRVVDENADVPTAQVMLVSGTDSMGLYNPDWRENLKFAAKIQNAAELMYPGLMRPIDLRTERFNLHMTTGSLILEVGSNGNTLEEAKNAGKDVARAIAAVLEK